MEPSYRLTPAAEPKAASVRDTAGSLGLHDTLKHGPRSLATDVAAGPSTALQSRLQNWEETQDNLKLTLQRNLNGLHAPMRLLMERKIVGFSPHMPAMPRSNIHLDILMGRDEELDTSDFMGGVESGPPMDIHGEMEKKLRM
ncbi:proteasome maturation factor UMP1 [Punctularia strigosozonata HHB-11173 SS5]|uniref:proteasome maturation factor UMP1 n=1 Tax=Punctularia strigosozonata (strain HHB-11173) TaxID=741275 RepID=UPI0004417948|nr:proteasome maturation factor UMP1 [Punctularia strigosozonata HHB-11173 SS5]EIN13460.1 proteasome maturation factor UMP1 [Punctularia strigosozonata HHB-11173 SS5]